MVAIIHRGYFCRVKYILGAGRKRGDCDKGGGVEVDMRGKGFILQWQQGATRGPLKAASRITSSSFPHWIQAPVEDIIVLLSLSAGYRAQECFVKSYLATQKIPPLPDKISSNIDSEGVSVWRCYIWLQCESTCWIQPAMAAWVSMSRDWICWMKVSFRSHCRHRQTKTQSIY